jgi:hypothetical protein
LSIRPRQQAIASGPTSLLDFGRDMFSAFFLAKRLLSVRAARFALSPICQLP